MLHWKKKFKICERAIGQSISVGCCSEKINDKINDLLEAVSNLNEQVEELKTEKNEQNVATNSNDYSQNSDDEIPTATNSFADSAEISNRINTDNDQDQQGDNAETNFEYSDDRDGDDQ